jgi:DNA-binding NarL/FixJ family response regulator
MPDITKILIYDDNRELASGLLLLLDTVPGFKVVACIENCDRIKEDLAKHEPDLVLMDIEMPGIGGLEGLKVAKMLHGGNIKILMLTVFEDNSKIFESLEHGADGYILKKTSPVKIIEFIKDAIEGGAPMTPSIARKVLESFSHKRVQQNDVLSVLSEREKEVLNRIVDGNSYKMIADLLFISIDTVRSHIKNIYEKLHVNSKSQAVAKALGKR